MGVVFAIRLEMIVLGWRETPKNMFPPVFRVLEQGDGRKISQVYFVSQFVLFLRFVDEQCVGSQDEVDGLPSLARNFRGLAHMVLPSQRVKGRCIPWFSAYVFERDRSSPHGPTRSSRSD